MNDLVAVVPAAGRGSRLGTDEPKILTDLGGQTVWDVLLGRIAQVTSRIHVVLSPDGSRAAERAGVVAPPGVTLSTSIQTSPTGMGDAVFGSRMHWADARHVIVVWGDQLGLQVETLRRVAERQLQAEAPAMTLPLVRTRRPYVDYQLDRRGRLLQVRQSREGDAPRAMGWSDVGLFALTNTGLAQAWERFVAADQGRGSQTGERNFLPFLSWLSVEESFRVARLRVDDPAEARGLNTPDDLAYFRDELEA